jgi:hypothetical protein
MKFVVNYLSLSHFYLGHVELLNKICLTTDTNTTEILELINKRKIKNLYCLVKPPMFLEKINVKSWNFIPKEKSFSDEVYGGSSLSLGAAIQYRERTYVFFWKKKKKLKQTYEAEQTRQI